MTVLEARKTKANHMAVNPLERAVKSAVKMNDEIGGMFARIGTVEHPRGYVVSAYRNALRAMKTALGEQNRVAASRDVMAELRRSVVTETRLLYADAVQAGAEEAARQMAFYGVTNRPIIQDASEIELALNIISARLDVQEASVMALLLTGAEDAQIIGDDERGGVLRYSDIAPVTASWLTTLLWRSFQRAVVESEQIAEPVKFQKQAVAALDAKTTDCCLRVHAQVQPMDKPFQLTGTPRYADEMDWPGFHWWCRTSGVLYLPEFDDGLTGRMRSGADWFIAQREAGNNPDRHPADAYG